MALESARIRCDLGQELQVFEENYAAALRLYAAAEPVLRSLGDDLGVATLLCLKGNGLYLQGGGNAEVVGILREALRLFRDRGDAYEVGLTFKYIVEAAADYDRAETRHFANMALAFAWETENRSLRLEIADLLSRIPK